jgi:hypothetical protein
MSEGERSILRRLVLDEIASIVADAKKAGRILRAGYHAGMLAARYGDCFSVGRMIDELVLEASRQHVPVEIGRDTD